MEIKRLQTGHLETNCYFFISGSQMAIIDPGGSKDIILDKAEKLGKKVRFIINTHYHSDHILANEEIKNKTKSEILIHELEKDFIDFVPDKFLKDGEKIKIGDEFLQVILTQGHSKGSICLLGKNLIFTGDTIFKEGYGRTDLPGGSQEEMEKSLEKLSKIIKPGMKVYPGHGETFKA